MAKNQPVLISGNQWADFKDLTESDKAIAAQAKARAAARALEPPKEPTKVVETFIETSSKTGKRTGRRNTIIGDLKTLAGGAGQVAAEDEEKENDPSKIPIEK